MFQVIEWRAYIKVKTEDKAKIVLRRLEKAIDCKVKLIGSDRYWKDETLFEVRFSTELGVEEASEAVFRTLLMGKQISHSFKVFGPHQTNNQSWEFEAITNKTSIPGVDWVMLRITNSE